MGIKHIFNVILDNVAQHIFYDMLNKGELPNIEEYVYSRGISVKKAITVFPSNTAPTQTSILTGVLAYKHHIPQMRFWKRGTFNIYHLGEHAPGTIDILSKLIPKEVNTLYEYINKQKAPFNTSYAFHFIVRGATDNYFKKWRLVWLFLKNKIKPFDWFQVHEMGFEKMMQIINKKTPFLTEVWLPGSDELMHHEGDSKNYRAIIKQFDGLFGEYIQGNSKYKGLKQLGILDETIITITSDHGAYKIENHFDMLKALLDKGLTVAHRESPKSDFVTADMVYCKSCGVSNLYFRGDDESWNKLPTYETLRKYPAFNNEDLIELLLDIPAIARVITRKDKDYIIISKEGISKISKKSAFTHSEMEFKYEIIEGKDPYNYDTQNPVSSLIDGNFHNSREWLEASYDAQNTDIVSLIPPMLDAVTAGDVIIEAKANWGFDPKGHPWSHDDSTKRSMQVPLLMAGPRITEKQIETARTIDLTKTLLDLLGIENILDGTSLL